MRFSRALAWILSATFLFPAHSISAESSLTPESAPRTVAVAAFKNGLAFVIRQGTVSLQSGTGSITPIPSATLGSLWLSSSDPGAYLDEVVAYRYEVPAERVIPSIVEVLQANIGKTVSFTYSMNMKEYTGEIVGIRDSAPKDAIDATGQPLISKTQYLLLRVDKKLLAFPLSSIADATFPDDTVFTEKVQRQQTALRFKVKGAAAKTNLTMGYLQQGLGWTPSYLISLEDEKNAKITMQAVLVDDTEDLKDADVFFVVGVPNFAYAGTPSPLTLQQNLLGFMQDAGRRDMGRSGAPYSNAIAGQLAVSEMSKDERSLMAMVPGGEELSGSPEEDLFLYTRSGVTLNRGERAAYNVFSGSVEYQHIYEWEVQDQPRVDAYGNPIQINSYAVPSDNKAANSIWHSIRLKNSTKFPWTSAPAMVISGNKPVSQDTIPYTPKSANSNLKITIATDIRSSQEEREIARQQNIQRRHGSEFDLVTVEGTLKLKNFKTKDVTVNIGKTLRGAVDSQTDEGESVRLGEAIQTDNPMSRLSWEILLKAGEERVIRYQYKIWVRG